jgi:hypothetical protein
LVASAGVIPTVDAELDEAETDLLTAPMRVAICVVKPSIEACMDETFWSSTSCEAARVENLAESTDESSPPSWAPPTFATVSVGAAAPPPPPTFAAGAGAGVEGVD